MPNQILNDLTSPDLAVTVLTDPTTIKLYRESVAKQINSQRMAQPPPKQVADLTDWISDIIIETTVQGASLLEVHIIDPGWILLQRDSAGVSFFDVDENGYLWPPIELNFPPGVSDAQWRLCQLRPSTDLTAANIIVTFEDKVVSVLREFSGPVLSHPNETRAEFIFRLVKEARVGGALAPDPNISAGTLGTGTDVPTIGTPDGSIRIISLLPNIDFTAADLSVDQFTLPASAKQPNKPPARGDPNKNGGGGNPRAGILPNLPSAQAVDGTTLSISEGFSVIPDPASGPMYVPPNTSAGNPEGISALPGQ